MWTAAKERKKISTIPSKNIKDTNKREHVSVHSGDRKKANYQLSTYVLYLKTNADRHECREERIWDTDFLVVCDGIFHGPVKLVLVRLHSGCFASRKHVDHSESKSLSQSKSIRHDYKADNKIALRQW